MAVHVPVLMDPGEFYVVLAACPGTGVRIEYKHQSTNLAKQRAELATLASGLLEWLHGQGYDIKREVLAPVVNGWLKPR